MTLPLIAVDVGNTRLKLGLFAAPLEETGAASACGKSLSPSRNLPTPARSLALPSLDWPEAELVAWLTHVPTESPWRVASVNRPAAARLMQWLAQRQSAMPAVLGQQGNTIRLLTAADLPITAAVEQPERIGIDRLAGAVAANRLRDAARPAIVIGAGTAITVDLISADGVFRGGAILPGIGTSAQALHQFTDLLPRSPVDQLATAPPALGTNTLEAIHSGLYWGAVGAMRELILRLSQSLGSGQPKPEIYLTGGAAPSVAAQLDPAAHYVEHLVLGGIALAQLQ